MDKEHWPPNSPDLNPLDYFYWNAVVTRMSKNKLYMNMEEFKNEIKNAMEKVPIEEIQKATKCFTSRVRRVENNYGKTLQT